MIRASLSKWKRRCYQNTKTNVVVSQYGIHYTIQYSLYSTDYVGTTILIIAVLAVPQYPAGLRHTSVIRAYRSHSLCTVLYYAVLFLYRRNPGIQALHRTIIWLHRLYRLHRLFLLLLPHTEKQLLLAIRVI